ncbi:MAG: ABC transporter permease [Cyclobacteriaceae bacterium]|nr:MAG: ABC transporter permease [Cyclobacteriaceae bacterium]
MINILGMTLGISCALVILNFVRYESGFDHHYQLADRTFRVVEQMKFQDGVKYLNTTAYPLANALRSEFPQLQYVTQTHGPVTGIINNPDLSQFEPFEDHQILFVDNFYLQIFNTDWLHGDPVTALNDLQSVVLTRSQAYKYFPEAISNGRSVLGRTINIKVPGEFEEQFKVSGIVADPPPNVTFRYSMLLPYTFYEKQDPYATGNWSGNYQGTTFLTLSPQQQPHEIEKLLPTFKSKYLSPEDNRRKSYYLQPLTDIHNDGTYGSAPGSYVLSSKYLYALTFLALLILILAAANFVNLTTAQAINRAKEVGVRKTIGSTRSQLIKQFLCETFVITLISAMLALSLTSTTLSSINELLGLIKLQLSIDNFTIVVTAGLILGVTFLAGLYPAIAISRWNALKALNTNLSTGAHNNTPIRKSLVVLQFAICQVLLGATLIVAWQLKFMNNKDLGFEQQEIVNLPIPEYDLERLEAFRTRLQQNPYIQQVSFASGVPTSHNLKLGTTFRLKSRPEESKLPAEMKVTDQHYLETYQLEMLAGTGVSMAKNDGQFTGFVVNKNLVDLLGLSPQEAIGQQIVINEGEAPIIGVVADFHNVSLRDDIEPCLIFNWYPDFLWEAGIKILPGRSIETLEFIEQSWKEFFPQSVYRFQFFQDYLNGIYATEKLLLTFVNAGAVLAIIIGCLGLYGLIVFSTSMRIKEIGVRKVLGASSSQIINLFSAEYIKLIGMAFIIATPLSWIALNKWLDGFVYRIDIGIGIFLLTLLIMLLVAAISAGFRMWKVIGSNPVNALRSE